MVGSVYNHHTTRHCLCCWSRESIHAEADEWDMTIRCCIQNPQISEEFKQEKGNPELEKICPNLRHPTQNIVKEEKESYAPFFVGQQPTKVLPRILNDSYRKDSLSRWRRGFFRYQNQYVSTPFSLRRCITSRSVAQTESRQRYGSSWIVWNKSSTKGTL